MLGTDGVSALTRLILSICAGHSSLPHTLPRTKESLASRPGFASYSRGAILRGASTPKETAGSVILARRQHPPADPYSLLH
jgi:hypothetical protein